MKSRVVICFFAIFLAGCSGDQPRNETLIRISGEPVTIDIFDSLNSKQLNRVIENPEFILLDCPVENDIQEISDIYFVQNRFLCADRKLSSILRFDTSGNFIDVVASPGKLRGRAMSVNGFFTSDDPPGFTVFSNNTRSLIKYSLVSDSIQDISLKFHGTNCLPFTGGGLAYYINYLAMPANGNFNLLITDDVGKIKERAFPYPGETPSAFDMSGCIAQTDSGVLFSEAFSDTIFHVSEKYIIPLYTIPIGISKMPRVLLLNIKRFQSNAARYSFIESDIIDHQDVLFFSYTHEKSRKFALYLKKSRQLYTSDNTRGHLLSLLFSTPRGKMSDGRMVSVISPALLSFYMQNDVLFKNKLKKELPGLYEISEKMIKEKKQALLIFNVNENQ